MKKSLSFIPVLLCTLLLGCSTVPTLGERMMNQGEGAAAIGKQWSEGQEQVSDGEAMIKEGEDMVKKGHSLVETGNQSMVDAESQYKKRFPQSYQNIFEQPK